jgi:hypothetical protein
MRTSAADKIVHTTAIANTDSNRIADRRADHKLEVGREPEKGNSRQTDAARVANPRSAVEC